MSHPSMIMNEQDRHNSVLISELIFDRSPLGMAVVSLDNRITRVNDSFCDIAGRGRENLLRRSLGSVFGTRHRTAIAGTLAKMANHDDDTLSIEIEQSPEGGPIRTLSAAITLIRDHGGKPWSYLAVFNDITERKAREKKLQRDREVALEQARHSIAFISNLSHEIKTPLSTIIGYSNMMLDCDDTSELREYINNIRESGNLLLSIINNILDQSKIEAGRIDIEHIPFSLESIISAAAGAASVLLAQTGKTVSIRQSVAPGIAKLLMGDPTRVLQVLNNLMSNAVKFTPDGFIEFGATLKEPSMLEFYVRDTGPGIEPACHEKIFEPFQQADTTITRNYGGTGLGLAISKKLTELMGGELRLTSGTGRAHGSTFYFTIPYEPLDDCADEAVTAPDKTEGRRPRVLVAEDNRTSGKIIGRLLEKLGCDVERAHDGRDAISKYKTIPGIDVIFMDIRMPVLDGKKSTAIIRTIEQKEKRRRIPIVALSASAMSDDRKQCLKAGCDLYMKKPVSTETLSRILDQLKKNPAARHAFQ